MDKVKLLKWTSIISFIIPVVILLYNMLITPYIICSLIYCPPDRGLLDPLLEPCPSLDSESGMAQALEEMCNTMRMIELASVILFPLLGVASGALYYHFKKKRPKPKKKRRKS